MKLPCKYCARPIDGRGMMSHVHFKHRRSVQVEFSLNWMVQWFVYGRIIGFTQLQLTAGK